MVKGLFGTFSYDDWLATEPDYCVHEDAENEDEVYERWKDEQC